MTDNDIDEYVEHILEHIGEKIAPTFDLNELMRLTTLRKSRTILLTGEIDDHESFSTSLEIEFLKAVSKKPMKIVVNNVGGDVYAALLIYNTMRAAIRDGVEIVAEVRGLAASAAVVVICGASKIKAWKASRFLFHETSETPQWVRDLSVSQMRDETEELIKLNNQLDSIIAKRCGKTVRQLATMQKRKNVWMSTKEAFAYGLIDEIIDADEPEAEAGEESEEGKKK